MVPPWWGIPVVLVVGIAIVGFGWWWDRRRTRLARQQLREAPASAIPGLTDLRTPAYVTEDDLAEFMVSSACAPDDRLDPAGLPVLPGGVPVAFLPTPIGRTVLTRPLVLVVDTTLDADRLALPALEHAVEVSRPIVLVAAGFSDDILAIMRVNAQAGNLRSLPVALPDVHDRRRAVALTGGRLVPYEDLAMGHLPKLAWGRCERWISNAESSWVELSADGVPPGVSTHP